MSNLPVVMQDEAQHSAESVFEVQLELDRMYPLSKRYILKRMLFSISHLMLMAVVSFVGYFYFADSQHFYGIHIQSFCAGAFLLLASCVLFRFLYDCLYRRCFKFGLANGKVYVKKGVIVKEEGSFPLEAITDIYFKRTISDYMLGIANLEVSTPSNSSLEFARIEGLSRKNAIGLKRYLMGAMRKATRTQKREPVHVPNILEEEFFDDFHEYVI